MLLYTTLMENLLKFANRTYSQAGQDGILSEIANRIGIKAGMFVEFGAANGIKNNNCLALHEKGWSGLYIESDKKEFKALKIHHGDKKRLKLHYGMVGTKKAFLFDNIYEMYYKNPIDICCIDIDGLDLEIFKTFERNMPSIVCIESGQILRPLQPEIPKDVAAKGSGQSLLVTAKVFKDAGYTLVASYQDCFFVKNEFASKFDVSSNLIEHYMNGLQASVYRLPYIAKVSNGAGYPNPIVKKILDNNNYEGYGYARRHQWSDAKKQEVIEYIESMKAEQIKYWNASLLG